MIKAAVVSVLVAGALVFTGGVGQAATPARGHLIVLPIDECASDINNLGVVVTSSHVVVLGRVRGLPKGLSSAAYLNDRGEIAGTDVNGNAALWNGRRTVSLGFAASGDDYSFVTGINANGDVVGVSGKSGDFESTHAFVWKSGTIKQLTGFSPATAASGINDRGEVVGYSLVDGQAQAIRWTAAGRPTRLPSLGGAGGTTQPFAINNQGVVVGTSYLGPNSGEQHAVSWSSSGVITDLNLPGSTFGLASGINNRGQVVGQMTNPVWSAYSSQSSFVAPATGPAVIVATSGQAAGDALSAINDFGVAVGCDFTDEGQNATLWIR